MKNKIFITNEHEDISIEMTLESDSAASPEQLIVRSIKALIRTMDLKDYQRHGGNAHLRLGSDLNEIAQALHDVATASGWSDAAKG